MLEKIDEITICICFAILSTKGSLIDSASEIVVFMQGRGAEFFLRSVNLFLLPIAS